MDLERLVTALAPLEVRGGAPTDVTDLAYDTRAVVPGALFFCVPGARVDGHDFAPEAMERGAAALVVERPLEAAIPQLVVPSARAAMAIAADEFFERPTEDLLLAGITGTTGKTTTSFLLWLIFEAAGMEPGLIGTIESRVGGEARPAVRTTPEAIDLQRTFRAMLDAGDRSCALEATSHGSELGRLERVRFRALAFTNLSQDHLDFHESMDRYFEAKRRLFTEHEPAALEAVLRTARRLTSGRLICVFGAGGDRDRGKRPLMGRVASELVELVIVTSDNPRSEDPLAIIDAIVAGVVGSAEVEPDRRAAIARAVGEAKEGDVVVIAGKGAEQGQEFADRKIPFDDREVAREELRRLRAPA